MSTIRIKVLRAFMLDRDRVAEVGQVIELDALTVYSLDRSKAEIIGDVKCAQELIDAAAKAHNDTLPRAPRGSQLIGESVTPAWRVLLPREPGYSAGRFH